MIHPGMMHFVSFPLVIVLPVFLRYTASEYLFGIFTLFLCYSLDVFLHVTINWCDIKLYKYPTVGTVQSPIEIL